MAKDRVGQVEALLEEVRQAGVPENLLRRALEAALAAIMEGEVTDLAGASYGEIKEARNTRRNGYRSRRFDTGLGTSILQIPRLRQGSYLPSFLRPHKRSDDALVLAVAQCYQQGVSTRNVEAVAQALGIESLSKSTVSQMSKELDSQVAAFRERPLGECPYVILDARYEYVREDHRVQKMAVLLAVGVRADGVREVLDYRVARVENEAFWGDFLRGMTERGLHGMKVVISDAHEGLRAAIAEAFPRARWQRCKVHFLRTLGGRIPRKKRGAMVSLAKTVFEQETMEEALEQRSLVVDLYERAGLREAARALEGSNDVLAHMQMPRDHWTKLHSTNLVERLNRELKRRTRVVSIFPNRRSLERLVGALLLEEHEEWMVSRRYISERSMRQLKSLAQQAEEIAPGAAALMAATSPGALGPQGTQRGITG